MSAGAAGIVDSSLAACPQVNPVSEMHISKKSPSQSLAAILCLLLTVATTMAESRLFILSGQSNMVKLNADKYFTPLIKEAHHFPAGRA